MDNKKTLKGGSYGEQRGLHLIGGFVVSETVHQRGQNLPHHAHERASINFVLDGAYAETFRGSSHAYGPATIIVKPAGEQHANNFRDASAHCLLIELTAARSATFQACFEATRAPSSRTATDLKAIALRIVRELRTRDAFSAIAVEANILELLVASARAQDKRNAGAAPKWLREVVEKLHDETIDSPLAQLADDAGVHPVHLARAFRKHFGSSPGEYSRLIRLNRAIELLAKSDEPIGKIALAAGFFDQSHFSRCVKQRTGMSPGALRRSRKC
jgi:AraC family transcriptional regulator